MINNRKPHPDIFLKCIKETNMEPNNCLILEDSKMGIIAAHRAKAITGFVPDLIAKDESFAHLINHEFKNLNEVIPFLKSQNYKD